MRSILGQHAIFLGTLLLSLSFALAQNGALDIPYYSGWKWSHPTTHHQRHTRSLTHAAS